MGKSAVLATMSELGKYRTGDYGRIEVYMDNVIDSRNDIANVLKNQYTVERMPCII